jgi:phosphatidylserine/phosphatidylglycerophosphate/cardiolipin synthase-like enzyme
MFLKFTPIAFAGRKVARLVAYVEHMRHYRRTLRLGAVEKEAAREARASSWWGSEPRWYAGGTPPRLHNHIDPLIDGESYFNALQECLSQARDYVYVAGWCFTPYLPLCRGSERALVESRLLTLLSATAQRVPVRVLLWAGAGLLIKPNIGQMRQVQSTIEREGAGDIRCELDHSAHITHCHHQKAIVVDGQVAFVGGMDLTTLSGDRWDTPSHPLRAGQNWHDVQLRLEGEAVADVEHNFRQRWEAVTGESGLPHLEPGFDPAWEVPAQVLRTIPARTYNFAPHGEFGIFHWYIQALRRARRLIYIENQYIWSPHVMNALQAAMEAPHKGPFRIVLVLPAFAGDGRWDNDKHIQALRNADRGRGIVSIYSPYASGPNAGEHPFSYRAIYVHAKAAIIDDAWLAAGSANLNNRGLITDGEIDLVVREPGLARRMRIALWAEHLGLPAHEIEGVDPVDLVDHRWVDVARRNEEIIQRGEQPLQGALHSYMVGHKPSDLVLEDVQALTFEH